MVSVVSITIRHITRENSVGLDDAVVVPAVLRIDAAHQRLVRPVRTPAILGQHLPDPEVIEHFLYFGIHRRFLPCRVSSQDEPQTCPKANVKVYADVASNILQMAVRNSVTNR
jgi:hypothetical protein